MRGKCGVVTSSVLGMQYQCDIENPGLKLRILPVGTEHVEYVLGQRIAGLGITDHQSLVFPEMQI